MSTLRRHIVFSSKISLAPASNNRSISISFRPPAASPIAPSSRNSDRRTAPAPMSPKVLGKRTRVEADITDSALTVTRSKRRLVLNEPNDENQNPFISHASNDESDEIVVAAPLKRKRGRPAKSQTVPAKHGQPEQRVVVSPVKLNASVKGTERQGVQVFEDKKVWTPTTPRHRDALAQKVAVTPRHRVLVAGGRLTPSTPRTPGTPLSSVYQPVRQLFSRCSAPGRLVGREAERNELATFINARLASSEGGCLYVSGPPGTGKSTLVAEVLQQIGDDVDVKRSTINCMSVHSIKDLSGKLCEDMNLGEGIELEGLRSFFVPGKPGRCQYIVVLDEVDRLVDLDLSLLYSLFEWSMQKTSRLILIGIANALDLTDRLLPRLKGRQIRPELLPFMPYDAAQIAEVLTTKLRSLSPSEAALPYLQPAAIQFCAKKVAAQSGDLRKAFDICKRAIDLVAQETREKDAELLLQYTPSKTALMENINLSSPASPRSPAKLVKPPSYTMQTAPKASIAHIAKVTAQVFGNGTTQRLSTLNMQQKAVLCALSALERRKRDTQLQKTIFATPSKHNASAPAIKQLYEAYTTLCKRDNLFPALTNTEFRDVVSGLETLSLISRVDANGTGSFALPLTPSRTPGRRSKSGFGTAQMGDDRKVASACGEAELRAALDGPGGELLMEMLEGDGLV